MDLLSSLRDMPGVAPRKTELLEQELLKIEGELEEL